MERPGGEAPLFVRLMSPELRLWKEVRIKFLPSIRVRACRGRSHTRVSTTVLHFTLQGGGGGVLHSDVYIGNSTTVSCV